MLVSVVSKPKSCATSVLKTLESRRPGFHAVNIKKKSKVDVGFVLPQVLTTLYFVGTHSITYNVIQINPADGEAVCAAPYTKLYCLHGKRKHRLHLTESYFGM